MQLNFFEHNHDTMLRNDVVHVIERHDAGAARSAWKVFNMAFADDATLQPLDVLVIALERRTAEVLADHDALRKARCGLQQEIGPAALRMLGERGAAVWLAPMWRGLAQRAAALAFLPGRSDDHATPMWLLAAEWQRAALAVVGIASWRRIPVPLAWMAEARYRMHGLDASLALLAELAWLSPQRFDALSRRIADPRLERLRHKLATRTTL